MANKQIPPESRSIGLAAEEGRSWLSKKMILMSRTKISKLRGLIILSFVAGSLFMLVWIVDMNLQPSSEAASNLKSTNYQQETQTTVATSTQLTCESLENDIRTQLNNNIYGKKPDYLISDFTLLLGTADGRTFSYSHGESSATTSYKSASTAKLVTAVIILSLVDKEYLSLSSSTNNILNYWLKTHSVTLKDLLSFTSGFKGITNICSLFKKNDLEKCTQKNYINYLKSDFKPGVQFNYSNTNIQIARLLAINSVNVKKGTTSLEWNDIFNEFKIETGLFSSSSFGKDLPDSKTSVMDEGGMNWTAEDYQAFLKALYFNQSPNGSQLLKKSTLQELFANQRGSSTMGESPAFKNLNEDWAYGLGNWLECQTATSANSFNCEAGKRNSSPGAYGAYPFIDFEKGYFGIVAEQGNLLSFPKGIKLFRTIKKYADDWASCVSATTTNTSNR